MALDWVNIHMRTAYEIASIKFNCALFEKNESAWCLGKSVIHDTIIMPATARAPKTHWFWQSNGLKYAHNFLLPRSMWICFVARSHEPNQLRTRFVIRHYARNIFSK